MSLANPIYHFLFDSEYVPLLPIKTPNNYPNENEIAKIAMNLPLFLLGVISVNIVAAKGAKNPIKKVET